MMLRELESRRHYVWRWLREAARPATPTCDQFD